MMMNPNAMVVMRRHPHYHLALTRGLDPHYVAVMTAQLCSSAPTRDVIVYQWRRQDLLQGGAKLEIWSYSTHG